MKILVVGGGAAGMMAAISAADQKAEVILLEKNEKLGKKLFITGKGRCNVTNGCDTSDFFPQVITNRKFLYSAVYSFDSAMVCAFLEQEGLKLKEERGQRIFPVSDKSSDVIRTLEKALLKRGVQIRLHTQVRELVVEEGVLKGVRLMNGSCIYGDRVILATGGLSYPSTGSTGDGYVFAQNTGHKVTSLRPSLVPLVAAEDYVRELEGLSLRNISIDMEGFHDFGEMLFTSDGVSGPVILSASAALAKKLENGGSGAAMQIDLKPALSEEQLDARILRDFESAINKDFRNSLSKLLPAKLVPVMVRLSGIDAGKKVHDITREERKTLVHLLKHFPLTITGTRGFEQAVITQGGVAVKDINPSTMESKILKGLFFAGEMIDVDAFTGGFNLQIAWSTGHLAGLSAAEDL